MRSKGGTVYGKLTKQAKRLKYAPSWFKVKSAVGLKSPFAVGTRFIVEDEHGRRYAKAGLANNTISCVQNMLPMGASIYMPVYLLFIKAVNIKLYSVYACYNSKACYPLFCIKDISALGELHKFKKEKLDE